MATITNDNLVSYAPSTQPLNQPPASASSTFSGTLNAALNSNPSTGTDAAADAALDDARHLIPPGRAEGYSKAELNERLTKHLAYQEKVKNAPKTQVELSQRLENLTNQTTALRNNNPAESGKALQVEVLLTRVESKLARADAALLKNGDKHTAVKLQASAERALDEAKKLLDAPILEDSSRWEESGGSHPVPATRNSVDSASLYVGQDDGRHLIPPNDIGNYSKAEMDARIDKHLEYNAKVKNIPNRQIDLVSRLEDLTIRVTDLKETDPDEALRVELLLSRAESRLARVDVASSGGNKDSALRIQNNAERALDEAKRLLDQGSQIAGVNTTDSLNYSG